MKENMTDIESRPTGSRLQDRITIFLCSRSVVGNADRFIRAFTLIETLVAMMVMGILMFAFMEGLRLYFRIQLRQTETLLAAEHERTGYFRLERLMSILDSIAIDPDDSSILRIWYSGKKAHLRHCDSMLLYEENEFTDTLMQRVIVFHLLPGSKADTLEVGFKTELKVRFVVVPPAQERHRISIEEIESGYGYD